MNRKTGFSSEYNTASLSCEFSQIQHFKLFAQIKYIDKFLTHVRWLRYLLTKHTHEMVFKFVIHKKYFFVCAE